MSEKNKIKSFIFVMKVYTLWKGYILRTLKAIQISLKIPINVVIHSNIFLFMVPSVDGFPVITKFFQRATRVSDTALSALLNNLSFDLVFDPYG